jgi:curved DNA-binding protein CbpA
MGCAAAAGVAGWAAWQLWQPDADIGRAVSGARIAQASAPKEMTPAGVPATGTPSEQPAAEISRGDAVGSAPDLRRLYDQYAASADPQQRRIAARAFGACVPAFLPSAGEAPSAEPLIQALPAAQKSEREGAYRALYARCARFMAENRAELASTYQALQGDADAREPGARATQALLDGHLDQVDRLIARATVGADPAAIESLSGLAVRLARERNPDQSDAALAETARAVDAALPAVACDLGLDCSANSLWSLQLCATAGACQGDLTARLAARTAGDPVDPALVQQQRQRLLALLRSGRALSAADLLP